MEHDKAPWSMYGDENNFFAGGGLDPIPGSADGDGADRDAGDRGPGALVATLMGTSGKHRDPFHVRRSSRSCSCRIEFFFRQYYI